MPASQRVRDYYYEDCATEFEERPTETYLRPVALTQRKTAQKSKVVLDTNLRSRCRFLFILVAVFAMVVTVRSGISASRGYTLVATQTKAQQLEQENERLRVQIAQLKAPHRIQAIASQKLNMQIPTKVYFSSR